VQTQAAPDNDVRIMAAVLLRKRIAGHWARVADHQTAITSTLLQMLQHDASVYAHSSLSLSRLDISISPAISLAIIYQASTSPWFVAD